MSEPLPDTRICVCCYKPADEHDLVRFQFVKPIDLDDQVHYCLICEECVTAALGDFWDEQEQRKRSQEQTTS